MLPVDLDSALKLDALKKAIMEPVGGCGFSLLPLPGNVGRFPVVVIINGDPKRRHEVLGPSYLRSQDTILKLELDASAGGGVEGDMWQVRTVPTDDSREDVRLVTNHQGVVCTAPPGAVFLFDLDTRFNPAAFLPLAATAETGGDGGDFFILPSNRGTFTQMTKPPTPPNPFYQAPASFSPAWDLTSFREVVFGVEVPFRGEPSGNADTLNTVQCSLAPWMQLAMRADGGPLNELSMGTAGDVGQEGVENVLYPGLNGYIRTGRPADAAGALTRDVVERPAYGRFFLRVGADNGLAPEDFENKRPFLRCYAYGRY